MKKLNPALVLILSILTLGIYDVIWVYKYGSECDCIDRINTGRAYRYGVLLYICGMASLAGGIYFCAALGNYLLGGVCAGIFLALRVTYAVIAGGFLDSANAQICAYFKVDYKPKKAALTLTAILFPFITVAIAQNDFNKAETVAREIEEKRK